MPAKRTFAVATHKEFSTSLSFQFAEDLHELGVNVLKILPPCPGREYSDAEAAKLISELNVWDHGAVLITEYDMSTGKETQWVKDSDE